MKEYLPGMPGVAGDGKHDDAAGLQALLDGRTASVYLPPPPVCYLIGSTLRIHSGQSLVLDRTTVVRLADQANREMLTNSDHEHGNHGITVTGGIWDGNNTHQTRMDLYAKQWTPENYIGVALQFCHVKDLTLRSLTLKDPESFGMQLGKLHQFTIDDITYDYNMFRRNMDGIHLNGLCSHGRISNLKGTTNDDLVALNADDAGGCEMTRGPITDIVVDSVFCEDGWTAVRLLSHGSPIRRVKLANIFGTYRYNVVSFTNHKVHPGEPSTFEDISIDGVFCSKSLKGLVHPPGPLWSGLAQIWIDTPAVVSRLSLHDYHRTESTLATDDIHIEAGARVENLLLDNVSLTNRSGAPVNLLHNQGTVDSLSLTNVSAKAEGTASGGCVVKNAGGIARVHQTNVTASGLDAGV